MLGFKWLALEVLLLLSPCATSASKEFFRLGRALRVTLTTGMWVVVHLFVVYGYQGAEEDSSGGLCRSDVAYCW